jgi:hypothetical protein
MPFLGYIVTLLDEPISQHETDLPTGGGRLPEREARLRRYCINDKHDVP